ncbi:hypothetical protein AAHC03_01075 [Spirometra sp. Aus1]
MPSSGLKHLRLVKLRVLSPPHNGLRLPTRALYADCPASQKNGRALSRPTGMRKGENDVRPRPSSQNEEDDEALRGGERSAEGRGGSGLEPIIFLKRSRPVVEGRPRL